VSIASTVSETFIPSQSKGFRPLPYTPAVDNDFRNLSLQLLVKNVGASLLRLSVLRTARWHFYVAVSRPPLASRFLASEARHPHRNSCRAAPMMIASPFAEHEQRHYLIMRGGTNGWR
jgi:hypothetical protein